MTVLLSSDEVAIRPIKNIYLLEDAWEIVDQEIKKALEESILRLRQMKNIQVSSLTVSDLMGEKINLSTCNEKAFIPLQNTEVWNAIGSWIEAFHPEMGPRVRNGLEHVKHSDRSILNNALCLKERIFKKISQFTKVGDLFCFPTVPIIAPLKGELDVPEKAMDYYKRTMSITSFAGVACLPEISIPVAKVRNIPIGLSLAAGYRQDEFLLTAAKQLFEEFL
jgi:amidase